MENEEITIDESIKSAFNDGYLIGKHRPEIAQTLQSNYTKDSTKDDIGLIGILVEGIEQGTKEIEKEKQLEQDLEGLKIIRKDSEAEKDLSPDIE